MISFLGRSIMMPMEKVAMMEAMIILAGIVVAKVESGISYFITFCDNMLCNYEKLFIVYCF